MNFGEGGKFTFHDLQVQSEGTSNFFLLAFGLYWEEFVNDPTVDSSLL